MLIFDYAWLGRGRLVGQRGNHYFDFRNSDFFIFTGIIKPLRGGNKMIHEHSAGSIIFRRNENKIQYLIVESVLHHTWGFPKGHLEKGETEREAAIREVAEEVGLHPKFNFEFKRQIEYVTEENTIKKVDFFLSEFVEDQKVVDQVEEILNSKWISLKQAKEYLPKGRGLYEILQAAEEYINKNE